MNASSTAGTVRLAAFAFDQEELFPAALSDLVSVDEIEQRSGLDLFQRLPDDIEDAAEASLITDDARTLIFPDD